MSTPKFVIIDGNAIVHRAYHAIPPLTTKDGLIVNAVYGFTSMLLKAISDIKPTYLAVTFDMAGGSTARLAKFADYKGTRVKADQALYDQIPLTHQMVEALGIPIYEKSGYEADDVIGTITDQLKNNQDIEVYIVTGDKDTLQLVNDTVRVYTLKQGLNDIIVYDPAKVQERYGFGPEMMVDYKAIRGDASDNIPGVPGIGEKGATELIQKVGSIETIYKKIDELKELGFKDGLIKKLVAGKASALMSKELSQIDCQVPSVDFKLENCRLKPFDREKLAVLFQRFEFISLLKRVPGGGGGGEESRIKNQEAGGEIKRNVKVKKELVFEEIGGEKDLAPVVALIKEKKQFTCRAITSGPDVFAATLQGLVIVVDNRAFHIKIARAEDFLPLQAIFADPTIELVGHDLKQLIKVLAVAAPNHPGLRPPLLPATAGKLQEGRNTDDSNDPSLRRRGLGGGFAVGNKLFDTMIAAYLLNPGNRATDVASIILKVLGKELPAGSGQESLFGVDARLVAHELYLLAQAAEQLKKDLRASDNLGLLERIEMPLELVLAEMELNGVAVDTEKLAELSTRVNKMIGEVTQKIYTLAGQEFNIGSPLQLREILFEKLEIPVDGIKKGKTGLSTGAEQLEKMRDLHPIIGEIEDYRELAKLENTYISVLPTLINKKTNRIHTTFNQAVAATGRLSSTDPNLQNIPIRTALGREIRDAFIAEPGNVLISADYSQIELRIVASLAEDQRMLGIFERDEDIHTATAAAIHGVPLAQVTKDMRRAAKEINFGVLYGMGVYGLSWRADISRAEAKAFIDTYFQEFSGVKKYIERTLEFTKKEGYCETLFGRRRYLPELNSTNFQLRSAAERMAINHPVQGTAADVIKMAMIKVSEEIKKLGNKEIKMTLQVHDELVLEVPEAEAQSVAAEVKKIMESVVQLRVPVKVEVAIGKRWGEIK